MFNFNWYEWYWRKNPPEEKEHAKSYLIDVLFKKAQILHLIGKWNDSIDLLNKGIELTKALPKLKKCRLQYLLAWVNQNKGDYNYAMELYQSAADTLKDEPDIESKKMYGSILYGIGQVYWDKGNYDQAIEYFEIYKKICEYTGDKLAYSSAVGGIGSVYHHKGDYDQAIKCYEIEKNISAELGSKRKYCIAVGNMAIIYDIKGDDDQAMKCYEIVKKISAEIGDKWGYGIAVGNIGEFYADKGNYDRAMEYFEEAIIGHQELGFKYGLTYWFKGKATCLFKKNKYIEAKEYADQCVALSTEISKLDTLFLGKVLQTKIAFASITNYELRMTNSIDVLEHILTETQDQIEQAIVHYELWLMKKAVLSSTFRVQSDGTNFRCETLNVELENHRQTAIELYQQLYQETPNVEYKTRIEALTANNI